MSTSGAAVGASPAPSLSPEEIDAVFRASLAAVAPIELRVAASAAERAMIHRLRYATVVERGWARPEQFPDGLERDDYDEHALLVGAWDGEALAGAGRLVLPASGRRLPTEDRFGLAIEPRGEVAEGGRYIVAPAYRGDERHALLTALFGVTWLEGRRRGFSRYAGSASARIAALYESMGFALTILGPPRRHFGEERFPFRLDAAPALAARWVG